MADKEKIRTEVERRMLATPQDGVVGYQRIWAYNDILFFIDSMEEDTASDELEEAAEKYANNTANLDSVETRLKAFRAGAKWEYGKMVEKGIEVTVSNTSFIALPSELNISAGDEVLIYEKEK